MNRLLQYLHVPRHLALAIALASAVILCAAYISQYGFGLKPCILCLYQRGPYALNIVLGGLAFLATFRYPRLALLLLCAAAVSFFTDAGIAGFHVGVEHGWWKGLSACGGDLVPHNVTIEELRNAMEHQNIVRCDKPAWLLFGISMAGYNFIAALALGFGSLYMLLKKTMPRKLKRTLPGDAVSENIDSMIRVDHAGEYGAKRIYEGQLAVLGKNPKTRKLIEHMAAQEQAHLDFFEKEIAARQVRPTALHPLWHAAGYALGAITAKMGAEAAMACTVAVEEVISEHYAEQLNALKKNPREKKLYAAIRKFKAEEEQHHAIGLKHDAEQASGYGLLTSAIKSGARLAIAVAKRV